MQEGIARVVASITFNTVDSSASAVAFSPRLLLQWFEMRNIQPVVSYPLPPLHILYSTSPPPAAVLLRPSAAVADPGDGAGKRGGVPPPPADAPQVPQEPLLPATQGSPAVRRESSDPSISAGTQVRVASMYKATVDAPAQRSPCIFVWWFGA
ncbi:uncharacterized protein LOC119300339 [Triticum dicoccoides]|uniref:uncharacterized protein LOC119300339 n=1 Tax=Triticum dicoccoides TaxID=85692 RepID=UPI0018902210|nr:uncharacterized protein LOC119300339 [Triticum dicoccoides]